MGTGDLGQENKGNHSMIAQATAISCFCAILVSPRLLLGEISTLRSWGIPSPRPVLCRMPIRKQHASYRVLRDPASLSFH
ncbi:hypothetical protein ASPSYDRAFT_40832 [Aspergillus sydowii CBS 593.65]|uniref:Uncharacterized protein n=1 Tax=Aspergillus sydowii CBS 593.65 TaxID=1036612 RepID=A0A1L9TRZ0_9EURO|nr:uncharacterized protein ASPSYDRAFT_40832 [Aspergillus sydowii CBS 593.65]OJJ62210.1 hypothetical protein ASPSYDRAFT_40832 [Aspergillus sydowii CBS 593.65]